ncbi:MAG: site-specific integrase [Clostridia bacterium]|nr:site-specific integrase [Clostridia bacterium]
MASVRARYDKNGKTTSFQLTACVGRDGNGKQMFVYKSFHVKPEWTPAKAKKEAEKEAVRWQKDIEEGRVATASVRFGAYINEVLQTKKSRELLKTTTYDRYIQFQKGITPALGNLKLGDLTPQHLNRFYADLKNGKVTGHKLANRTVNAYHGFISSVLTQAYKEGLIINNPAERVTLFKAQKRRVDSLTAEQVQTIRDEITSDSMLWQAAMVLLIGTGARRGELCGLRWEDVDFAEGVVSINRNLIRSREAGGVCIDTPKTEQSKRVIPLTRDVLDFLRVYRSWQKAEKVRTGGFYQLNGWILTSADGNTMIPDSLTNYCEKLSKRLGFHINPHLFRHTQASLLLANNVPLTDVAKRLGHSQTSTTLNIYAHAIKMNPADDRCVQMLQSIGL